MESATGSQCASTLAASVLAHGATEYETIWPAASNSKHSHPQLDYSFVRVLSVHFELMN